MITKLAENLQGWSTHDDLDISRKKLDEIRPGSGRKMDIRFKLQSGGPDRSKYIYIYIFIYIIRFRYSRPFQAAWNGFDISGHFPAEFGQASF